MRRCIAGIIHRLKRERDPRKPIPLRTSTPRGPALPADPMPALLALADGTVFRGRSIGPDGLSVGEVVFNTAITGYQEILTHPSYCRQIVTLTYPHLCTTATPGTTRDAVDAQIEHRGRTYVLTDTAGLRKKRQVVDKVEVFSAQRALRAIEHADVVVVLTDATDLGVEQDARIAAQAEERGRAVILAVNKWDLVREKEGQAERLRKEAARHLQHVGYAPLLFVSAKEGTRLQKILDVAAELHDQASTRLKTPELNDWVQSMQDEHPAPLWRGYPVRFSYAYQVGEQPVTIAVQCNRPEAVDASYRRYLTAGLRERFELQGPVRLPFPAKNGPPPPRRTGPRAGSPPPPP